MNRIKWFCAVRAVAYLFSAALLVLLASRPAAAQQVVSNEPKEHCWYDSEGQYSCMQGYLEMDICYGAQSNQTEIYTYVWTGADYDLSWNYLNTYAGYDFYHNSQYVYGNGDMEHDSGSASVGDTYVNMSAGLQELYALNGDYELYWEDCCGQWDCPYQWSLQTSGNAYANWPHVASIDPAGDALGVQDKQMSVTGYNLVDYATCYTDPQMSGYGITVNPYSPNCDGTGMTVIYSISSGASTGDQSFTVQTSAHASNAVTFNVSTCPVPTSLTAATTDDGAGKLLSIFNWSSTSGTVTNLNQCSCIVQEEVDYPGSPGHYFWPDPPWSNAYYNINPNIYPSDGYDARLGQIFDTQHTGHFLSPTNGPGQPFSATQYLTSSCTGVNNGNRVRFGGPFIINRSVTQAGGSLTYTGTKNGASASCQVGVNCENQ